jgi:hypothetical protein
VAVGAYSSAGEMPVQFASLVEPAVMKLVQESMRRGLAAGAPVRPDGCSARRCQLGRCLKPERICDRVWDCQDGEDERNCADYTAVGRLQACEVAGAACHCPATYGKCANNLCLPSGRYCDGKDDCGDSSDEQDCANCGKKTAFFQPSKLCDGEAWCEDAGDEAAGFCPSCEEDSFRCDHLELGQEPACVPRAAVCDGVADCANGEDEATATCVALEPLLGNIVMDGLLTARRLPVGYIHVRLEGAWYSYCAGDQWTTDHSDQLCDALGYKGGNSHDLATVTGLPEDVSRHFVLFLGP